MGTKVFQVIKATKRNITGIGGAGRHLKFGSSGAFQTKDAGLAREIDQKWGPDGRGTGEVVVVETDSRPEAGHRYTFAMPAMPWHKDYQEPTEKEKNWLKRTWRMLGQWKATGGDPDAFGSR